ncbi:MAG: hypothetical protein GY755_18685 [Chloroflexi bacterium]|nr:hypothetical protein [Chloroflexota bacterium]
MKKNQILIIALAIVIILATTLPVGANAAPIEKRDSELRNFHGKWISIREGIHQSLKIRCNSKKSYCKITLIAEESRTCTAQFGEPTDALLKGKNQVQVIDDTIEIFVDAYCLSKPPTYSFSFPVYYTYNEMNDTLTDNLDVIWHRK